MPVAPRPAPLRGCTAAARVYARANAGAAGETGSVREDWTVVPGDESGSDSRIGMWAAGPPGGSRIVTIRRPRRAGTDRAGTDRAGTVTGARADAPGAGR